MLIVLQDYFLPLVPGRVSDRGGRDLLVNALDLHTIYMRIVSFVVPLPFGAVFFWQRYSA